MFELMPRTKIHMWDGQVPPAPPPSPSPTPTPTPKPTNPIGS